MQQVFMVSRATHMVCGAITACVALGPYIFKSAELQSVAVPIVSAGLMVLTGLFNAGALKPGKKMGARANPWRVIVYGGKGVMLLACTPLADKVVGKENAVAVRAFAVVASIALGTAAKFYREENEKKE